MVPKAQREAAVITRTVQSYSRRCISTDEAQRNTGKRAEQREFYSLAGGAAPSRAYRFAAEL